MPTTYACKCRRCKELTYIMAHPKDVEKWFDGALIQDALPYLTPDEREMMITRICRTCYTSMFGSDDDV